MTEWVVFVLGFVAGVLVLPLALCVAATFRCNREILRDLFGETST
jgi:hypothetical protein